MDENHGPFLLLKVHSAWPVKTQGLDQGADKGWRGGTGSDRVKWHAGFRADDLGRSRFAYRRHRWALDATDNLRLSAQPAAGQARRVRTLWRARGRTNRKRSDLTIAIAKSSSKNGLKGLVTIAIANDGSISFNGQIVGEDQLAALLDKIHDVDVDIPILIKADEASQVKKLAFVMDSCRQAHPQQVQPAIAVRRLRAPGCAIIALPAGSAASFTRPVALI